MKQKLPKLGFLYLDYVLRFFDHSNFKGWPDKIETVTYHWKNDKKRFIKEVEKKKIDVLIGNIPATAYEAFREISRELPHVRFIPSIDTQFSNKSKENVTRFAWKYNLPIPKTHIFYDRKKGYEFLESTDYPKIIKRSYGPSNYGGYFVHKVDSKEEAIKLFDVKKYHPIYVQDFIPMEADIRVMLIGHKPVCAFWRRAPEGEWLTNTSQGGSMDYQDVPKSVLDLAVKVSKAANAEYWACDIAYGKDGKVRILECATAFAAFPYIRDWIGQYLMWSLSGGKMKKPHLPMFNWEELGKINSSMLRTMRHIAFGKYTPSYDGAYFDGKKKAYGNGTYYIHELDEQYPIFDVATKKYEEWPSEKWDFQDRFPFKSIKSMEVENLENFDARQSGDEASEEVVITREDLEELFNSVNGLGAKKIEQIFKKFSEDELVENLEFMPQRFSEIKGIKNKTIDKIIKAWVKFKEDRVS